jgi:hypothetical protein
MTDERFEVEGALTAGPFAMLYGPLILDREISDGAFRTYALIWVLSGAKREEWWSQSNLGKIRGLDRRNVRRHIQELEAAGLVEVFRDTGKPCRVRVKEPTQVFGRKIASFYADVRDLVGGGTNLSQVKGGTETSQEGGTKTSHKVDKGEVEKESPTESDAPGSPGDSDSGSGGPIPSGPDGAQDGGPADASDCGKEDGNWWADEVMFSDTGEVPKKPKARKRSQARKNGKSSPKRATSAAKRPSQPVWALWTHFRRTVESKWPEMNIPLKPVGREWANLKKMLEEYGENDAKRIIDLAVADWTAIKEKWFRVAKGEITTFYAVFTLRADLMAAVASGSGVTTRGNRVSAYAEKHSEQPEHGWGDLFDK